MYKTPSEHQISIFDFNQSCGTLLDEKNEWIRLADADSYVHAMQPALTGSEAFLPLFLGPD